MTDQPRPWDNWAEWEKIPFRKREAIYNDYARQDKARRLEALAKEWAATVGTQPAQAYTVLKAADRAPALKAALSPLVCLTVTHPTKALGWFLRRHPNLFDRVVSGKVVRWQLRKEYHPQDQPPQPPQG